MARQGFLEDVSCFGRYEYSLMGELQARQEVAGFGRIGQGYVSGQGGQDGKFQAFATFSRSPNPMGDLW